MEPSYRSGVSLEEGAADCGGGGGWHCTALLPLSLFSGGIYLTVTLRSGDFTIKLYETGHCENQSGATKNYLINLPIILLIRVGHVLRLVFYLTRNL